MDPYLNSLAYRLLAETIPEPRTPQIQAHHREWGKRLLRRLGGLLVALGQKMQASGLDVQAAFEDTGYRSLDDEVCAYK